MPTALPTPELVFIADLTVTVGQPIEAGMVRGLNSQGRRRIIRARPPTRNCTRCCAPSSPG